MKIYIQLPISGRSLDEARKEAAELAKVVTDAGHEAITPFDLHLPEDMTSEVALPACIEALFRCDALLFHPINSLRSINSPMPSRGCMAELTVAMTYGKPIYTVTDGNLTQMPDYDVAKTINPLVMSYVKGILFIYAYKENKDGYDSGTTYFGDAHDICHAIANTVVENGVPAKLIQAATTSAILYNMTKNGETDV